MPARERSTEFERNRGIAYAAVTASFDGDRAIITDLVYELIQQPADAADALLALIQACYATTELWAKAIEEEPVKAWARYAKTVAWAVSQEG